jgi:CheY-like chemotaxis protein
VLIIDDDPLIRTLLVSALRKECFVAVAAEGAEGFSKALELRPDVAVIDVNMPVWDGLKTLEAFRGHTRLKGIKIIMLTADASKQTVMAAVRAGADDYLIKTSFSKADFYRKLNQLIPGTIQESPLISQPRAAQVDAGLPGDCNDDTMGAALAGSSLHGPHRPDAAATAAADGVAIVSTSQSSDDARLQVMIDGWE